jgi:lipopolysaccharide transport system ATP-binding protein
MYRVMLLIVKDERIHIYKIEDLLVFEVKEISERGGAWHGKWQGAVRPNLKWNTNLIKELDVDVGKNNP